MKLGLSTFKLIRPGPGPFKFRSLCQWHLPVAFTGCLGKWPLALAGDSESEPGLPIA
jgi:hypothetical protein